MDGLSLDAPRRVPAVLVYDTAAQPFEQACALSRSGPVGSCSWPRTPS